MDRLAVLIATFGYAGYFPIAPGTAGSLAAFALYLPLRLTGMPALEGAAIVVTLLVGVWAATAAERALGRKDPGPVVVDEVLGMLVTLAFIPVSPMGAAIGFVLFRIFDVAKPYPAGRLEHLPSGWGIMMDDAMAGIYAHLVLRAILALRPEWIV